MSYLLSNKGAHIYTGNGDQKCSNCKRVFSSAKTLLNHKCAHCLKCNRTYTTYKRFETHLCKETNHKQIQQLCNSGAKQLTKMIDTAILITDDVICQVLNILRASYPQVRVGDILPGEVQVILQYTVKPAPRIPVDSHAVNIHFTKGHWITSWQDPCHMTVHILDSLYSDTRVQDITPALQLFYNTNRYKVVYEYCVSQQTSANCGAYAAAYAYYCCQHINPKQIPFDESRIRQNLKTSITNNRMVNFSTVATQEKVLRMQSNREGAEYRHQEKIHKQLKRASTEYRHQEKIHKQTKRASTEYRHQEKIHKQLKRASTEFRHQEKIHKQTKRASTEYRHQEKIHKQTKRASTEYRHQEKIHKQTKRASTEYRHQEKIHKQTKEYRHQEKIHKQTKRASTEYRHQEKIHKQTKRASTEYRHQEKIHKQTKEYKHQEKINKQAKRASKEYQEKEKQSKRQKRDSSVYRQCEKELKKLRAETNMIEQFHDSVTKGPVFTCTCCEQLWYRNNVRKVTPMTVSNEQQKQCISNGIKSHDGVQYLCSTCKKYLAKNRLPPLSKANGVKFPDRPPQLDLTQLEERLVSARIPFMHIRELPRGGQASMAGNVVNVPTNINRTVTSLPRTEDEYDCIAVKLKRKLSYKHHYLYEYIRPLQVKKAIQWLVANSALYKAEGITINHSWVSPTAAADTSADTTADTPADTTGHTPADFHHDASSDTVTEFTCGVNRDINPDAICDTTASIPCDTVRNETHDVSPTMTCDMHAAMTADKTACICDTTTDVTRDKATTDNSEQDGPEMFERDTGDAGPSDTMLQPIDVMEDSRDILSIAPGEGSSPVSIFLDRNAESLAFPTLFCGEERKQPNEYEVKVYTSDLYKSELRRTDRRAAGHIGDIFFKLKYLQMKHILDKASICLRKTCSINQNLTAGFLKNTENLKNIIHTDLGFRIFRDLRGSPPYWEKVKKDLFALIRFLGIPTWFTSFSSADTRWTHLLQILGQTVDKKVYTDEQVKQFSWFKKQELVKKDPVTCARHFDYQVRTFISNVLCNSSSPIGHIQDFFYKVEFQMRGSPHIHMLIWIKDAPNLDKDEEETVIDFVNHYVTCENSEELSDLVQLQIHSHSRTCKKKNNPVCRFNFPVPPMAQTCILQPLEEELDDDKNLHADNWTKVATFLRNLKPENTDMSYAEFLKQVQLTEAVYIKAVRSTLSSPKLFLKRSPGEVRVNSYNPTLLKSWRANMDLQYVLDAYSCAMYIVSYVAKSQRGMSNLMYHAAKEAREGNKDIREQVKFIGNKFLNNVEISAQEAVYFILQIPLYKSSRDVQFINTSPAEKRSVMLKDFSIIKNLSNDSPDVIAEGVLQHYAARPMQLQQTCLADFVSCYRRVKNLKSSASNTIDCHNPDDEDDCEDADNCIRLSTGDGYSIVKRKKQQCIRYVRYHPDKDAENYFRECLMLFVAWRNETEIIGDSETYFEQYQKVTQSGEDLKIKMAEYQHKSQQLDEVVDHLEQINEDMLQDQWNQVAPNTEHVEEQCAVMQVSSNFHERDGTDHQNEEAAELNTGLGLSSDTTEAESFVINLIPDQEYYNLLSSLNQDQMAFFYYVLDRVKNHPDTPFHVYLGGGAGVGKTAVTKAVYQMLLRTLNKTPGVNPDQLKVLLGAPTGKAAFLIGGNTLHHIFHIPASQGFEYRSLAHEKLNTLRCQFAHVKVLIIDEISMVGNKMFNFINQRLREVMGNSKDFGGLSVITVGDFYQLKPVFDAWIFKNLSEDYGPLARNLWTDLFRVFSLTKIMRQKDDLPYAQLLNRLRTASHTSADIELLKTRCLTCAFPSPDYPMNVPHIFTTNPKVALHNERVFDLANAPDKITVRSWDVVLGDKPDAVKRRILEVVPNDLSKTMGLCSKLQIAIGSRVEISTNVDVQDGLSNGACGEVMTVTNAGSSTGATIWVKFDSEDIGRKLRQTVKQTRQVRNGWTPITQLKRQFPVGRYKNAEVLRSQFPLRPSAAKTAHRCQGDTLHSAVVDFEGWAPNHSHYVSLSRVTSLNNVHILTLNESAIRASKSVKEELRRLTAEMPLQQTLQFPAKHLHGILVLFQNVRALKPYLANIQKDPYYSLADVIVLVETRLSNTDSDQSVDIEGYYIYRHDCPRPGNPMYGIVVYSKMPLQQISAARNTSTSGVIESVSLNIESTDITVVGLYASPHIGHSTLWSFLDQEVSDINGQVLVLGDFNIDLNKVKPQFPPCFQLLRQCITSPTTEHLSILDHIYTNIPREALDVGVFETYFSNHKPIWACIKDHTD